MNVRICVFVLVEKWLWAKVNKERNTFITAGSILSRSGIKFSACLVIFRRKDSDSPFLLLSHYKLSPTSCKLLPRSELSVYGDLL